jgi:small subunit ribosomal protein S20
MAHAPSKTLEVTVANIKSQKKRILTNAKAADRNRAVRSELKTRVKSATTSIGTDDDSSLRIAMSKIDRAVAKGILHKNTAARKKSRLMQKINAGS